MEFIRKQKVLRQKFYLRVCVCFVSALIGWIYLKSNDSDNFWNLIIGICASAFVWSLVELFDFFVNTFNQHESERNVFLRFTFKYFSDMKNIIRSNKQEIDMHQIREKVIELQNEMNDFVFDSYVYSISKEFEQCSNYIERMYWKFYACCSGIYDDCEEKEEYYNKLYNSLIVIRTEQDKTSKRFFEGFFSQNSFGEMTDIELSFDKYQLPENLLDEGVEGNISETITVPGNLRKTITFKPDLDFYDLRHKTNTNAFILVLFILFRKVMKTK